MYSRATETDAMQAKVLTDDEARRVAANIARLPYVYSYLVDPAKSWDQHFAFARAASTYKIQHLGNEAGLPVLADIDALRRKFGDVA